MAKQRSQENLYGIVIKKFIEEHNHDYRNIEVLELNDQEVYLLYFGARMHEDFFNFIEEKDTIRKNQNSLTYEVRKLNGHKKSFFLNFACPDTVALPR